MVEKGKRKEITREIIGGATTFLAAMYIIVVNPTILSQAGMPFNGVLTATILVSAFSSIAMGIYARNPILVAPGMGLNAFFTYSVVLGMGIPWQTALGAVFISGIVFILLSVFNVRTWIVEAIPKQIRYGVAVGIGLFITLIGFINAKFIVANPATVLGFAGLNSLTIILIVGLLFTAVMVAKEIKGALIIGIFFTSLLAFGEGRFWGDEIIVHWKGLTAMPDFSFLFQMDVAGAFKLSLWPVIFAFLFTDMFDSLSTFVGVAEASGLLDEKGEPLRIKESLIVDGFATLIAGLLGSSPGTSYIESAAGIREGGRTGLTAVVAGLLFLPFMFFSPLLDMIPQIATAPALILVGVFMSKPVTKINWDKFDDAFPAFLTIILIPTTYSITQGIIWGFISWTVIKLVLGKKEDITPVLLIIDVFAVLALVV